ncbi:SRPBCC family protein [Nocardioides panacisoli]|uniref:SRPBCC family protein n=1 Tax=Nocardioides panacisoli TaxID=627624 RepID=A0ABP7J2J1_9ACTN
MPTYDAAPLQAEIEISAPPEEVWALVSDLPRMAAWSPQVVRTFVRGGRPVALGTKTVNINRSGPFFWPTNSKVIEFEPARRLTFRIKDNWMHWSYQLDATPDGGTRVVHRREAPDGLAPISARFQRLAMGGPEKFDAQVRAGMDTTLERIKAEVES